MSNIWKCKRGMNGQVSAAVHMKVCFGRVSGQGKMEGLNGALFALFFRDCPSHGQKQLPNVLMRTFNQISEIKHLHKKLAVDFL